MKVYYKEVGRQLKQRMKDRGITTEQLVSRCKIPKSTLNKFFNDEAYKGYIKILEKLSIPLDISTLEISFFENPNDYNNDSYSSSTKRFVIKEQSSQYLFNPDTLLPENRKIFDKLVKKNEEDIIRREAALEKQKLKKK